MDYTEKELAKLIETVETEFTAYLGKAEAANSLAKSEDGEKKEAKPASDKKPEEKAPEAEAKPAAEGEKPAAAAAPAEGAKPAAPAAPADAAAAPAAGHGYDDEDMAHMDKMYASMSREELMAHHDSIRKALDAQGAQAAAPAAPAPAAPGAEMGKSEAGKSELKDENPELNSKPKDNAKAMNSDPKNGGMEGSQPSGSPGAKSEASKDSANLKDAMAKAEHARRNGGKIEGQSPSGSPGAKSPASTDQRNLSNMEKSETELLKSELEAEKAKSADLKKNFDAVQEFLTKFVGKITAPKGKAITEIAALDKNESAGETPNFSKAEVTEKLLKKSSDPKLEKSDRAAINEFYATGQVNINSISHLLK